MGCRRFFLIRWVKVCVLDYLVEGWKCTRVHQRGSGIVIGDIFKVDIGIELPTGTASTGFYVRQTADASSLTDPEQLAAGVDQNIRPPLIDVLSVDIETSAIKARKTFGTLEPTHEEWGASGNTGLRAGTSLPSNCALLLQLSQGLFGFRHNGRLFIPGCSEDDSDGPLWNTAFLDVEVRALQVALLGDYAPAGDTARFEIGVINRTVLGSPPTDWPGSFAPVTQISAQRVIAIKNRARRTKQRGKVA